MNPELIAIPEDQLFEYLVNLDGPVMEHDLIKNFLMAGTGAGHEHTLFVKHFSLYHALYKLKFSAGSEGYYLHLDCMRIRLVHIPGSGMCRHYDPESGAFCSNDAHGDYCELHESGYVNYRSSMTFDFLQDFYCDRENITFGDSELLRRIMCGIRVYSFRRSDIDMALKFFGIHKPGRKIITMRYRELAGKYHPDRCGGSEEMMKRLNSSYMILKDVFIV
ncbi:MAG TPA: J domain-containing protein [Spirochaetota bacterium]|nr:J domain-containing protein [Spirochaetota bacterium]